MSQIAPIFHKIIRTSDFFCLIKVFLYFKYFKIKVIHHSETFFDFVS